MRSVSRFQTCSALKQKYRDVLQVNEQIKFVYLKGDYDVILKRMQSRQHFMKPEMLKSQFEALEEPKGAVVVNVEKEIGEIVEMIKRELAITSTTSSPSSPSRPK